MDRDPARALAEASLASHGRDLVILDERTVERAKFWVFFATTRAHAESGDVRHMIPGLGPIAVVKADGRVVPLATSVPPARAIAIFEQQLG